MTGQLTKDGVFFCAVSFPKERPGSVPADRILHAMEQIAGAHYDALGLGRDEAVRHGCFWALTRTELEICRPVLPERELTLETWSGRQAHGLFWRHYRLTDNRGETLLRAVSIWVLMELENRTLSADRSWITEKGGVSRPGELPATLRKPLFPENLPNRRLRTVEPEDTDINGHLNNARYIRWAEELFSPGPQAGRLRRIWIEYRKEIPLGETVALQWAEENGVLFLRGSAGEHDCFSARCEYDPIQQ